MIRGARMSAKLFTNNVVEAVIVYIIILNIFLQDCTAPCMSIC